MTEVATRETPSPIKVIAAPEAAGSRLDKLLAAEVPQLSRARVQSLIRDGQVSSAGRTLGDPGYRVKPGEAFDIAIPEARPDTPTGEAIRLVVAYEDEHLIVVDKPAGLVVHPAAGHATGTLVNALIAHCGDSLSGIGGVKRPGIVHRLDKDTSGLLVVAKNDETHRGLSEQFAAHGRDGRLVRRYEALAWGVPDRPRGMIDAAISRSPSARTKMAVSSGESARHAVTHYEVSETFRDAAGQPAVASRMSLHLETGRTHQIRVHMAHVGHPLLGDAVYGAGFKASATRLAPAAQAALAALGRQALHAAELGFEHPVTGEALHFASALPPDLARLLEAMRTAAPEPPKRRPAARRR